MPAHTTPIQPSLVPRLQTPGPSPKRTRSQAKVRLPQQGGAYQAMVILLITVALVTSVRLAIELARPLQDAYSRGHEIIRLEDQIDVAKLNNQKLIAENNYLKTKFGVEQEARRLGYVFPEERTLRLAGWLEPDPVAAGAPQNGPTATASVVHAGKALADQIRDTVRTFLAAGGRRRHKL